MQTCIQDSYIPDRLPGPSSKAAGSAARMGEYLARATQRLAAIAESISRGESVDRDSHEWMLAQVDFLSDSFADETLELGDEMHSSVLQLVLAIANLNEQIRHRSSLRL